MRMTTSQPTLPLDTEYSDETAARLRRVGDGEDDDVDERVREEEPATEDSGDDELETDKTTENTEDSRQKEKTVDPDDEDFLRQFEQMVAENREQRKQDSSLVPTNAPVAIRAIVKSAFFLFA